MTSEPDHSQSQPSATPPESDAWREELARPGRGRRVTPLTALLAAAVLAAVAFAGGVLVEKGRGDSGNGAAGAAARAAFGGGFGGAGAFGNAGAGGGGATVGEVKTIDGDTLFVTGSDGTTVKVVTAPTTRVSSVKTETLSSLRPGDTVSVLGTAGEDGAVTAARITIGTAADLAAQRGGGAFAGGGRAGLAECLQERGIDAAPGGTGFDSSDPEVRSALQQCRGSLGGGAAP